MIHIRLSVPEDASLLTEWLMEGDTLQWFPMTDQREIDDSVKIWMSYLRFGASFTAEYEGKAAGMALLYLQPYERFKHHALFAIIVDAKCRGQGIGKTLIEHLEKVAKEQFHLELLHLEVYANNPAKRLYERQGFVEYGRHPRFIKSGGKYVDKVMMQKELIYGRT